MTPKKITPELIAIIDGFVVWRNAFFADKTLEPSLAHSAQITTEA
jgi:hypothetical protein